MFVYSKRVQSQYKDNLLAYHLNHIDVVVFSYCCKYIAMTKQPSRYCKEWQRGQEGRRNVNKKIFMMPGRKI